MTKLSAVKQVQTGTEHFLTKASTENISKAFKISSTTIGEEYDKWKTIDASLSRASELLWISFLKESN